MKKQTGIWIDGSKAVIVHLVDGKERVEEVDAEVENNVHHFSDGNAGVHMGSRHLVPEKKFGEREKHELDSYLDTVIKHLKGSDELYVFGPAETRLHLQHKMGSEKSYGDLAARLKAVEPSDYLTHNQIVSQVKRFFM